MADSNEKQKKINKAMRYAYKLKGVKRKDGKCYESTDKPSKEPFWIENNKPPSLEIIRKGGVNCAGFPNLIRRYMGLDIPGIINGEKKMKFPGGTGTWFDYLKKKKRLKKIDYSKTYPKGTLLLEDFNPINQGHLAIVWTENKKGLLYSKLIQSRWESNIKSVNIDYFYNYKYKDKINKRFSHICLPEDWLLKN